MNKQNWEIVRTYHLEVASHVNIMGNVKLSEQHTEASMLASRCKTNKAFERSYNSFVTDNKIKKYV